MPHCSNWQSRKLMPDSVGCGAWQPTKTTPSMTLHERNKACRALTTPFFLTFFSSRPYARPIGGKKIKWSNRFLHRVLGLAPLSTRHPWLAPCIIGVLSLLRPIPRIGSLRIPKLCTVLYTALDEFRSLGRNERDGCCWASGEEKGRV